MSRHSLTTRSDRRTLLKTSAAVAAGTALARVGIGQEPPPMVEVNAVHPTEEQSQAFAALPDKGPIVMLNLLKFKANGGLAEYMKYGTGVRPLLARYGARTLFTARADFCLVGNGDWDMMALVEYPSKATFFAMTSSPEYQALHHHREAGLEGQILYAMTRLGGAQPA